MKPLHYLVAIALVAHLLTLILYQNAASQPGGTGAGMVFIFLWMPAIWISTLISVLIIGIVKRKRLFSKGQSKWVIITLIFCTPLPLWIAYGITHPQPDTAATGSMYHPKNGKVYKTEYWNYTSGGNNYVTKYFVADSLAEISRGEDAFVKDSTWVYFTKTGDTLKIEHYKTGKLVSGRQSADQTH
ncbi:MAG: hypothetical protein REI78_09465 [Pedobacter sp.]|nr:hypothetical protein [Pedobacter sp.]MDQ8053244.1 hypothetical protein [Pedobacter sp.]